jgi:hypothetical protein
MTLKPFQCPECKVIITKEENAKRVKGRLVCVWCARIPCLAPGSLLGLVGIPE